MRMAIYGGKKIRKKKLLNCISGEVCGGDPVLLPYSEKIATSINVACMCQRTC